MIFVHVWEVLERPFAEHKVPKCQRIKTMETSSQWRHMYNKENDQLFIYGPRCDFFNNLGYLGGPGNAWGEDFNNRIGPISVRIYYFIYDNLHVRYGSNLIRTLLIKILNMKNMVFCLIFCAESRGTKMPRNADQIILETYVQQGT